MLHSQSLTYEVSGVVQDQDTVHRLSVVGHQLLLGLHMCRTMLHKAVPKVVSGPLVMPMMMGLIPYRKLTAAMYHDGLILALLLLFGIGAAVIYAHQK